MKKLFKILVWVIIVAIFISTLVFLAQKTQTEPMVYKVEKPKKINIEKTTVATGSIEPRKEIKIKPQVSGIVQELFVKPGEQIKEGQVIARIKVIPDMLSLNSAESRVKQARLKFKNEQVKYQRQKQLYEKNVISEAEFQTTELQYQSTKEELDNAENSLEIIKKGVNKSSEKQSNTLIRSTISGMILDIPIKEGNSVIQSNNFNEGTTVAIIADMNDMIFLGKIDETEVGRVVKGMPMTLTIGALENVKFDANLEYISPKGVLQNGAVLFEIKAKVKLKSDHFIRSGYSANANIVLQKRDSVMAISERLITFRGDTAFVELLQGTDTLSTEQAFKQQKIEIGLSDGINVEVLEGLKWDDLIKGELKMNDSF